MLLSTEEGKDVTDAFATVSSPENVVDADLGIVDYLEKRLLSSYLPQCCWCLSDDCSLPKQLPGENYIKKKNTFFLRELTLYFVSAVEGLLDTTAEPGTKYR